MAILRLGGQGRLGGELGVKEWLKEAYQARAWLPMASLVQHEVVGALLIQAKNPIIAVAASPGDIRASAEKQLL